MHPRKTGDAEKPGQTKNRDGAGLKEPCQTPDQEKERVEQQGFVGSGGVQVAEPPPPVLGLLNPCTIGEVIRDIHGDPNRDLLGCRRWKGWAPSADKSMRVDVRDHQADGH